MDMAKSKATIGISYFRENQKGFTLIEIIITIIIIGIVSSVAIGIVSICAESISRVSNSSRGQSDLRMVMRIIRSDFQKIKASKIDSDHMDNDELFFKDIDGNDVNYQLTNSALQRQVNNNSWQTILTNVQQNPFTYLNQNLSSTTNRLNVKFINVSLEVNYNGNVKSLNDRFYLRN
jgi:prepilin-type N-terminal cleavage/methylation domain-containing protein